MLLISAVSLDALLDKVLRLVPGRTSRDGTDCELTGWGWGCVLRTASANIRCKSAFVGLEGFVIWHYFSFNFAASLAKRSAFNR